MRIARKIRADIAASLALVEAMTAKDPRDWLCHAAEREPGEVRRVVVLDERRDVHV